MKIEAVNIAGGATTPQPVAADEVAAARKKKADLSQDAEETAKAKQPQPEELLQQIKGLAQRSFARSQPRKSSN